VAETLRQGETRLIVPAATKVIDCRKRPEHLMMLCAGAVEISLPCRNPAMILGIAGAGWIFGLRALVSGKLPETEVICHTECELRLLPERLFTSTLKSHPEMYLPVAKLLSADLQLAQAYLKNRRKLRVKERPLLPACDQA
jgi:CRP-like cAMP-binding protein